MVKYLAQNQISDIQDIKNFNDLGYKFDEKISDLNNLKFVRFSNKQLSSAGFLRKNIYFIDFNIVN